MALTKCLDCSREVSTLATSCPHCGRPVVPPQFLPLIPPPTLRRAPHKRPFFQKYAWPIVLIFGAVLALSIIGSQKGSDPAGESEQTVQTTEPEPKPQSVEKKKRPALTESQYKVIQTLENSGMLELEADRSRALIDPIAWVSMDAHAKENFALILACACAEKRGQDVATSIDIVDKQSGRTLGSWGPFAGFKTE